MDLGADRKPARKKKKIEWTMEYMTCKFCNDQLEADETEFHGCFVGRLEDLRVDDNGISFLVETCNPNAEPGMEIGLDEMLISEVKKYPPLYDHRLPIEQRSRVKRQSCWLAIFDSLGGRIALTDLAKKWKNERDKYIKAKHDANKYIPSGSAANQKKLTKYKNYELMQFLNDSLENKETTSNINFGASSSQSADDQSESDAIEIPPSNPSNSSGSSFSTNTVAPNKRKRDKSSNIEEALLEAIRQPMQMPPPPTPPPTPPIVNEVDAFCARLAASLKRLNPCDRAQAEMKMLQVLLRWEYNTK